MAYVKQTEVKFGLSSTRTKRK